MRVTRREEIEAFLVFQRVMGRVLLSGNRLMFFLVEIEPGGIVPEHGHPHEQMGLCLRGKALFKANNETKVVEAGMAYWFPSSERHSVKAIGDEPCILLDVFSPPREDYLLRQREISKESST